MAPRRLRPGHARTGAAAQPHRQGGDLRGPDARRPGHRRPHRLPPRGHPRRRRPHHGGVPRGVPRGSDARLHRAARAGPARRLHGLAHQGPRAARPAGPAGARAGGPSSHARVDELQSFHEHRLDQSLAALAAGPATGQAVARTLAWTRHETSYDDLDLFSRGMAAMETKAHLELLVARGRATRRETPDGVLFAAAGR